VYFKKSVDHSYSKVFYLASDLCLSISYIRPYQLQIQCLLMTAPRQIMGIINEVHGILTKHMSQTLYS